MQAETVNELEVLAALASTDQLRPTHKAELVEYIPDNPLIIQSDHSLLLEVHSPRSEAAREAIAPFAELVKSPEHIHAKMGSENIIAR